MHLLLGIADIIEDAIFNREVSFECGAPCRARVREINALVESGAMTFDKGRALSMEQLRIALKSLPPTPYTPVPFPAFKDRRHALAS